MNDQKIVVRRALWMTFAGFLHHLTNLGPNEIVREWYDLPLYGNQAFQRHSTLAKNIVQDDTHLHTM